MAAVVEAAVTTIAKIATDIRTMTTPAFLGRRHYITPTPNAQDTPAESTNWTALL